MGTGCYVITGASQGIGYSLAKGLIEAGEKVVVTARSKKDLSAAFHDENIAREVVQIPWDLSGSGTLDKYVSKTIELAGPVSGFVHCAGLSDIRALSMVNDKYIEDMFRIHTFAAIRLCALFSKPGRFVNNEMSIILLSSLSAHEGALGRSVYAAAKGALEGFIAPAASELAQKGIRLNIVIPGLVLTKRTEEYLARLSDEKRDMIDKDYPLGLGKAENIADMIMFLLSPKSNWITGQKIIMDGGHSIRKC